MCVVGTCRQRGSAEGRAAGPRSCAGTDLLGRLQGAGAGGRAAPPAVPAAAAAVGPG